MTALDHVLGAPPVAAAARRFLGGELRILAYHAVGDVDRFADHMRALVRHYTPVAADDVVAATVGGRLPERAVWVTFDDGYRSVVDRALPVLAELGIRATAFLCPGAVTTGEPLWFDVVRAACGVVAPWASNPEAERALAELKRLPDAERRARVAELPVRGGDDLPATLEHWQEWTAAGCTLGNHTWDHPCLDRCPPEEERAQIAAGRDWLDRVQPGGPRLFAYPNGFHTAGAAAVLEDLDYDAAVLFDHRIAEPSTNRFHLSRLRIADTAGPARFRAVLSGSHAAALHVRDRRAAAR